MDSTVLVKGWKKGANWSFPRGKINKDEDDLECAIREVYEETGYDLHAAGLVPPNRDVKHIEITMREQQMRLYVFRDVPMDTHFAPRTRKEISKISWYNLSELPAFRKKGNNQNDAAASAAAANANKFYMVAPFLVPLKKWVVQQKKRDNAKNTQQVHFQPQNLYDEPVTEDDAWVQNKPTAAVVEHTPALDTLEGATKELQRLLKVQPNTQGLQMPSMSDVNRDKGASLLAVLQANSQVQNSGPQIQVPHTPIDYIENASIQTTRLHHQHHPQPRAPLSSYQPPPQFPLEANVPVQYSSHHQQFAQGVPVQGRFQQPHQRLHAASPRATYGNPSPSTEYPTGVDGPTRHEIRPQGYSRPEGLAQFTQNYMPIPKPPPTQLTNHSMALLGVLKSGSKSPNPAPGGNCQQPHIVTNETGQQQGHQPGSNVQSAQYQSSPAFWQQEAPRSAHVSAQNGPGRSTTGTEEHRSALLQMFKKPEGDNAPTTGVARANQGSEAPKTATVGSKHTHGSGHSGVELNPLSSQPIMQQAEQGSAAHQPNLAEPSNLSRMQPNKGATPTPPFTILRRPEVLGQTTAPRQVERMMAMESSATVTISRAYFDTLIRRRPRHAQYAKTAIRTVVLYDLAETTTHADITDVVRGGMLLEVLIKTHDRSAQISFLHAESAQAFYNHVSRHDLYIRQKRVNIKWSDRQCVLPGHVSHKIGSGATRNLIVRRCSPEVTAESIRDDLEHIHNLVIIRISFEAGSCFIQTNSVYNAMFARTCMMSRYKYKGSKVEWDADGCTAPLESLVVSKTQARAAAAWSKVELTAMANRFHILDPGGLSSEDTDETDTFASQP
ncbi:hypothetical protein BN1723_001992 [Verticillium longisporum]|uniref:Nudix hydrolase domain-containing protein n=1 Tax=Verticillium longisporum TaxID=100787 RepID=A0A0G4KVE4_VERLO|nr:hypothetical protein BN1723_001992 [Verticillium longisporum]